MLACPSCLVHPTRLGRYLGVQLLATLAACYTTFLVHEGLPYQHLSQPEVTSTIGLNTMIFTLLIVFVHLNVLGAQGRVTSDRGNVLSEANGFFGYAIGFAYLAGIWIFAGNNGASASNPFIALCIHLGARLHLLTDILPQC